jgi:hypothetical protein
MDELVNASGYNSGDEYGPCESGHISEAEWLEVECPFFLSCYIIQYCYDIMYVLLLFICRETGGLRRA